MLLNWNGVIGVSSCRVEVMTKSELIERIAQKQTHLAYRDVELAVKTILEQMGKWLAGGDRIEIRGFGSFSLHYRPRRLGRNPKTGTPVALPAKHVPHFKPGKELRERVDGSARRSRAQAAARAAANREESAQSVA
jgi:integration host factor subunit beta